MDKTYQDIHLQHVHGESCYIKRAVKIINIAFLDDTMEITLFEDSTLKTITLPKMPMFKLIID